MAGNAFSKFVDSMRRIITKTSVRTSSSIEKSKIKLHIESLTKDVQKMLTDVGEKVYALWLNGEISNQSLVEKMEAVKQKKNEIEQLSIELVSIDARKNEILGTKADAEPKAEAVVPQKFCCPNCGSEREPTANFCRKCGNKLQ